MLATLNVLLNPFVDEDLNKISMGARDVKVFPRFESKAKCLIIVIEVEVDFGEKDGNNFFVLEVRVCQQFLSK